MNRDGKVAIENENAPIGAKYEDYDTFNVEAGSKVEDNSRFEEDEKRQLAENILKQRELELREQEILRKEKRNKSIFTFLIVIACIIMLVWFLVESYKEGLAVKQANKHLETVLRVVSEQEAKDGIWGQFDKVGQKHAYQVITSVAGKYRIEIEDDNADAGYKLIVSDSTGKEYKNTSLSQGKGVTVTLEANKEYIFELRQNDELANYRLIIHMPEAEKVIDFEERMVSGAIQYENQVDRYIYRPEISGFYRFDIEDDNEDASYRFVVTDERGETLRDSYIDYEKGMTVELEAGKAYYISLEQYYYFANYSLKIGVPKETQIITDSTFSGSISYVDQQDRYVYTASVSGMYDFKIEDDNADASYYLSVIDSRGAGLKYIYFDTEDEIRVSLEAGEEYTILLDQYNNFANYTVNIDY